MNEQDIYSLLIGYLLFSAGVFIFCVWKMLKLCPGERMPLSMAAHVALTAIFPIANIVLLVNVIRAKDDQ